MKYNSIKVLLLWIVQILFYFTTIYITAYKHAILFTISYVLVHILFLFIPDKQAFVLFILGTILSVFYLFYQSWVYLWSTSLQLKYMITHFLTVANFFFVYISTYMLKQVILENKNLTERIQVLEQYIGESKLLTRTEFERRQTLLIAAMKRRSETGIIIYFDFISFSKHTKKSVMDRIASLLLSTVRRDFDLVGKYDHHTLVTLLQNTDIAGAEIVMNRLYPKMKESLTDDAIQQIQITQKQVNGQESSPL
ncbi:dGTP triphosphohydrolase [Bacillus cytotoxicus]|uniref:Response regulator receiver protein n=1 Tax=Bacillus cytotoxicus (strain DSM 22905 / CIP 110041 / 391-98 / NVH 391-98) TaxID=315749 RepID=A7GV03_BACCN|nr:MULTISPECIES: hypothetical protein [Bacillus cereus group]ABS23961.1 response regulator receiver protein [Bacillus cytotoxicus NVH 391-98]AWC46559.1 dGTP triphosphohydrolase [Bacillus cytotoxicus]MDH2864664.1 dGTP triphosphohydrolase [Bacillus cytotoxicus]MDH2881598.1 dGTP triphosphohydrolase [Bacillus cytotoxicus]MDH2884748.1 dGTP triphosphohydrolase [Bacillus cytotoxicus]